MPDFFKSAARASHRMLGNLRDHEKRGQQMVSFWWVAAAFIGGGFAGVLLMALMHMAGGVGEQSPNVPDLNGMPW
jgi:hypothetical protein